MAKERKPRWRLEPASMQRHCDGCSAEVQHEIVCGMSVHVMCKECLRAIGAEIRKLELRAICDRAQARRKESDT